MKEQSDFLKQVKIIKSSNVKDFENDINDFLDRYDPEDVIDIKFTESCGNFVAYIIYKNF